MSQKRGVCYLAISVNSKNIEIAKVTDDKQDSKIVELLVVQDYSGYTEKALVDKAVFVSEFMNILAQAAKKMNAVPNYIKVSVPSIFADYQIKTLKKQFGKTVRISESIINDILSTKIQSIPQDCIQLDLSALYYQDGQKIVHSVLNCERDSIEIKSSLSLMKIEYKEMIEKAIFKVYPNEELEIEYIPSDLAKAKYFIPEKDRLTSTAVLCTIGEIASTLSYVRGDGVLVSKSFEYGSAHMAAKVYQELELPKFKFAEDCIQLLNISNTRSNSVAIPYNQEQIEVPASYFTDIMRDYADQFKKILNDTILSINYNLLPNYPLYISGTGLVKVSGFDEYLKQQNSNMKLAVDNKYPSLKYARYSGLQAIIDYPVNNTIDDNVSVVEKIKNKIKSAFKKVNNGGLNNGF